MIRLLLWLSRCWHWFKDALEPHVKIRKGWDYDRDGDTRRDI